MSPLNLLVVINNYPPDVAGGASVIGDMCQSLATKDIAITVRCAYPYYPEWRDKSGRNGRLIWRYRDGLVNIERFGLYIPRNPSSFLQRLLHEASFFLSLLRSIFQVRQFNVVMSYYPAVTCLAFGVVCKFIYRIPLWMNVQDLAVEAALATGQLRPGITSKIFTWLQTWMFNRADVWSTISPEMAIALDRVRARGQHQVLVPNWAHKSLMDQITQKPRKSGRLSGERPPCLLYSGNIGHKQNLLALLRQLRTCNNNFTFRIHGDGAKAAEVKQWLLEVKDPRFVFGPLLDEPQFAEALHKADFYVITEKPDSGTAFMPSKLIPGMTAGCAIFAVSDSNSPLGNEVRSHHVGPWLDWNDIQQAAGILRDAATNPALYSLWVNNAYKRAGFYDRDVIIDRVAGTLRKLGKGEHLSSDH